MNNQRRIERLAHQIDRCLAIMRGDLTGYRMKLDELSARVEVLERAHAEYEERFDPYRTVTTAADGPMTIEAG